VIKARSVPASFDPGRAGRTVPSLRDDPRLRGANGGSRAKHMPFRSGCLSRLFVIHWHRRCMKKAVKDFKHAFNLSFGLENSTWLDNRLDFSVHHIRITL
jgi:hypothetical protein